MNGATQYGWVSRLIHWVMAAALLGSLGFGTVLARTQPTLDTLWMFPLHKSAGLTLLALVLLRLIWHRISPPPQPLADGRALVAARLAHGALYALMLAVPLSGWIASAATGLDVALWGWTLPRIAPVSEAWETGAFAAHGVLTKLLMGLVVLHAGAAIWHAARGEATLRRMLRGQA